MGSINEKRRSLPAYNGKNLKILDPYQRATFFLTSDYIELFVYNKNNHLLDAKKENFRSNLRNRIYEFGTIYSGQITINAFREYYLYKRTPTKEHYFNRAKSSKILMDKLHDWVHFNINTQKLVEFIRLICTVHHTTPKENAILEKFQNDPNLKKKTADEIYDLAGVYKFYKPSAIKKVVFYDNLKFNDINHAAETFQKHKSTISKWINDPTKPEWSAISHLDYFYDMYFRDYEYDETFELLQKDGLLV